MLNIFLLGAAGYPILELLYRRRTHYSMSFAGGASVCMMAAIQKLPLSRSARSFISAVCITGIEYAAGFIWNRKYRIWDYRHLPCNYRGQICLQFSVMWGLLSYGCFFIFDRLKWRSSTHSTAATVYSTR